MSEILADLVVYLDSASVFLLETLGIDISEKKIIEICESQNLNVFNFGTRKVCYRNEFLAKFREYSKENFKEVVKKKQNRVSGALLYNGKVDVIFSYVVYLIDLGAFDLVECHQFMRYFDKDAFNEFSIEDLKSFISSRRKRKTESTEKANLASAALVKAKGRKSSSTKEQRRKKQNLRLEGLDQGSKKLGLNAQIDNPEA